MRQAQGGNAQVGEIKGRRKKDRMIRKGEKQQYLREIPQLSLGVNMPEKMLDFEF